MIARADGEPLHAIFEEAIFGSCLGREGHRQKGGAGKGRSAPCV